MTPPVFEVVVNQSTKGGFCLSLDAVKWMAMNGYDEADHAIETGGELVFASSFRNHDRRHESWLVRAVQSLGPMASDGGSCLRVVPVFGKSYSIVSNGHLEVAVSELVHPQMDFVEVPDELRS